LQTAFFVGAVYVMGFVLISFCVAYLRLYKISVKN